LTLEAFQGRYCHQKVHSNSISKPLRAGELARLCGVSTDTLRHYERVGVLSRPLRTPAGYRQYPAEAEARVRLVRRAVALGFTLAELARILRVKDRGGAPCREVRTLAAAKLEQVEQQLADLSALRDRLCGLLADWDDKLKGTPDGRRAHLLEMLLALPSGKGRLS
jgi:MerR family mercuric resistance operon transcriptional regulator